MLCWKKLFKNMFFLSNKWVIAQNQKVIKYISQKFPLEHWEINGFNLNVFFYSADVKGSNYLHT